MKQLEKRIYMKDELIQILKLEGASKKNLARTIQTKLTQYGYSFTTIGYKKVEVVSVPETPEARLKEMMMRIFNLDIQLDTYAFGCFIAMLNSDDCGFLSMPWDERAKVLEEYYDVKVQTRTMMNWFSKLKNGGFIDKTTEKTEWITQGMKEHKIRMRADEVEDIAEAYKAKRKELIGLEMRNGLSFPQAYKKVVYEDLYNSRQFHHLIMYKVDTLSFSAFGEDYSYEDMEEIIDLCNEIAEGEPFILDTKCLVSCVKKPVDNGFVF